MPSNKELLLKDNNSNMNPFPRARAILSKENRPSLENGETSFRVYYGATGAAVPFMWESQPGTPKHPNFDKNDNIVPPLTPPPSYASTPSREFSRKARKNKIFRAFLSSFTRRSRSHVTPTPSLSYSNSYSSPLSWSTSSTSSSSPRSSPRKKCDIFHRRNFSFCTISSAKSSFSAEEKEDEHNVKKFSASTLCFGLKTQQRC